MKKIASLVLTLFTVFQINGQSNFCATDYSDEMYDWLREFVQNPANLQFKRSSEPIMLPLQIHIVGNDIGDGYYSSRTLLTVLCELNDYFDDTGFRFYLHDDVNYINSTSLFVHSSSFAIAPLINATRAANAINMYFVQDPSGACGYYSGGATSQGALEEGGLDFMMINRSNNCAGPGNITIAHEIGHYFSLPHPFFRWEGGNVPDNPEYVTRDPATRNCHETADLFCDTDADYFYERWSAPYNFAANPFGFELIDPLGEPIDPDPTLIMGYANESGNPSPNRFSNEQMAAMNGFLMARRTNLLQHPEPVTQEITQTATLVSPSQGSTVTANYVNLKWNHVPNATHYSVQVATNVGFTNLPVDTIVSDTSLVVTNLAPNNSNYRFRVTPFNQTSFCTEASSITTFATGGASPISPNLVTRFCADETLGSITLNPTGGTPPYQYVWAGGFSGNQVSNLFPGNYNVTIQDADGNSLPLSIDLFPYEPLELEVLVGPGLLAAEVSGGKEPYSYEWSNGFVDRKIFELDQGSYTVEVTDATGCTISGQASITGIQEPGEEFSNVRVYPNPTQSTGVVYVVFETILNVDGKLSLYNNQGQQIMERNVSIISGMNSESITIENLPQGVYIIRLEAGNSIMNKRLIVL
ncbi:MAG: T9SS C-terminal target domain-containing protein [Chitinophagaceae bacterium]|nr:MAG: T9SS C-terminal target domain-containing protein [Chitinophagaceae bacterium]